MLAETRQDIETLQELRGLAQRSVRDLNDELDYMKRMVLKSLYFDRFLQHLLDPEDERHYISQYE